MMRWILVSGWLMASLLLVHNRLNANERVTRSATISRRVETHVRFLGVEWTRVVRESPAVDGCDAGNGVTGSPLVVE